MFSAELRSSNVIYGDSLFFCTFFPVSPGSLCAFNKPGGAENPFTGQRDDLARSTSALAFWETSPAETAYALVDSALFTGENEYEIQTLIQPLASRDALRVIMIRRTESRRVERNADGAVANDILVSAQDDLILWDKMNPDDVDVLVEDIALNDALGSHIAINADGSRIAFTQLNSGISVFDIETREVAGGFPGNFPQLSASGKYVVGYDRLSSNGAVYVYDVDGGVRQDSISVLSPLAFVVDKETDSMYFFDSNEAVSVYGFEGKEQEVVFTFRQLEEAIQREPERNPDSPARFSYRTIYLLGPRNDNRLVIITQVEVDDISTYNDGCS